ncbi:MAG: hypothetical protein WCS69_05930 [Ignavibacteriaceae bacterium]
MEHCLSYTAQKRNLTNDNTYGSYVAPIIKCFAVALFLITFVGCSSTYRISDSPSKEKFYDEFNNSFKTKETKVTLINDSLVIANEGAVIENDTLFSFGRLEEKKNYQFALSDIEEINFENNTIQKASIVLKSGDELSAETIRTTHDSLSFIGTKTMRTKNTVSVIDKVKTVSYKNRWRNIPLGVITGFFTGGAISLAIGGLLGEYKEQQFPPVMTDQHPLSPLEKAVGYYFLGALLGSITGGILGSVLGREIIYQFNP